MRFAPAAQITVLTAILAACASGGAGTKGTAPAPSGPANPALPPVPEVTGKLSLRVVYPPSEHMIESRDSNFIFGSVGNGKATLTINGTPVAVAPNGAFLAFLPLPPRETGRYDLVATAGADTASLAYPVKLPPPVMHFAPTGPLAYDTASVAPAPNVRLALRDDEMVRVSIRAPSNATVIWRGDAGATAFLVNGSARWDRGSSACPPPRSRVGGTPAIRSSTRPIYPPGRSARARSS